jgi:hypothetical protein
MLRSNAMRSPMRATLEFIFRAGRYADAISYLLIAFLRLVILPPFFHYLMGIDDTYYYSSELLRI